MPSKEQYYISWLAKHIVQNIKAQNNKTSVVAAQTLKASAKTTKSAEGILNLSSKIWLQDTSWRLYSAYQRWSNVIPLRRTSATPSFGQNIFRCPKVTHTMKSLGGRKHGEPFTNSKSFCILRRQGKDLSNTRTHHCPSWWCQRQDEQETTAA